MSTFSRITGHDAKLRQRQIDEQNRYGRAGGSPTDLYYGAIADEHNGGGWQNAFNQTAGATLANALPDLRQNLQMTREDGIRRGISTGDLGTSNEGDVVSSWGRNLANAFAGQSFNAFDSSRNRYLDLITGQIDRDDSNANAGKNRRAALWGAGINAVGQAAGAFAGK